MGFVLWISIALTPYQELGDLGALAVSHHLHTQHPIPYAYPELMPSSATKPSVLSVSSVVNALRPSRRKLSSPRIARLPQKLLTEASED